MTDIFIPKKPPIFKWTPPPLFRSELEKQRYYQKEKQYWIEGKDGLTGTLYHYLKEQKIKDRVTGQIIRPIPYESDMLVHEKIRDCRNAEEPHPLGIIKPRGIGLSTWYGSLTNYFMRVYPGSTSLITSADQSRISKLYNDKIKVTHENYNQDIRYSISKKNETLSKTYLQIEVKHLDDDGKETISYSDIFCNQTNDSDDAASSFSGTGAIFGGYDEIALNKRRKKLLQSSIECYRDPSTGKMKGFLLAGGTVEDSLTNEDLLEFQKLILDATAYNMEVLFIPFYWKFHDENGYIDQRTGEEWWNREYDRLSKLEDKSHLRAFIKNNPRTIDDIFELASGGRWEESTLETIKSQKKAILNADISLTKHHFVYLKGVVNAPQNNQGSAWILEHPKPNCRYISCVDGVATDTDTGDKEGSNMAAVIVKIMDASGDPYMPVSIHSERPKTIAGGYEKLINQARYYNKYGGFEKFYAEANASTASHFAAFLMSNDLGQWISKRKDLSGKGWVDTKKMFQYRTPELIDFQYKQANIFLRKFAHSIQMMPLIEQMLLPKNANADILDAWLQFFTAVPNFDEKPKPKAIPKPREIVTVQMVNGYSQRVNIPMP